MQKKTWTTPKLEELTIGETLSGPINALAEGVYVVAPFAGLPNTNGSLAS